MIWHAQLHLTYQSENQRTVARFEHSGPLRVLQSLYPEGPTVCHNILVHPPSGIVAGDVLDIHVQLAPQAHALITTPGATRFYKSTGAPGVQRVHAQLQAGSRLEWLPLETICYDGCNAYNRAVFDLASGAEMLGWDITALGLPHANLPFTLGSLDQHIEVQNAWLERAVICADDTRLRNSPLGLAGHQCMGTLFFAAGEAISRERRELLLEAIRSSIAGHSLAATTGATAPNPRVIVVRTLAPVVEPAIDLLRTIWQSLRQVAWQVGDKPPRIWSM